MCDHLNSTHNKLLQYLSIFLICIEAESNFSMCEKWFSFTCHDVFVKTSPNYGFHSEQHHVSLKLNYLTELNSSIKMTMTNLNREGSTIEDK